MTTFAETIFPWLLKLRRPDGTLADGQCEPGGALRVSVVQNSAAPGTWVEPERGSPLVDSRVVTRTPGRSMRAIFVANAGPSLRWLQLFDLAAAPIASAQPVLAWPVAAGAGIVVPVRRVFATGVVWAASTTPGTYTADPSALFWVNADLDA